MIIQITNEVVVGHMQMACRVILLPLKKVESRNQEEEETSRLEVVVPLPKEK